MVAFDVPAESFDVIDQGRLRSVADVLSIHGHTNTSVLAAAGRLVLQYEKFPNYVWATDKSVTRTEISEFILSHAGEVHQLDSSVFAKPRSVPIRATNWLALNWLVLRHSVQEDLWPSFYSGVSTGADLSKDDPRLTLRNGKGLPQTHGTWAAQSHLAIYLKAWNAHVLGSKVKRLQFLRKELPMPRVR